MSDLWVEKFKKISKIDCGGNADSGPKSLERGLYFLNKNLESSEEIREKVNKNLDRDEKDKSFWTDEHWTSASEVFDTTIYVYDETASTVQCFSFDAEADCNPSSSVLIFKSGKKKPHYQVGVKEGENSLHHKLLVDRVKNIINKTSESNVSLIKEFKEEIQSLIKEIDEYVPTILCLGNAGQGKSYLINNLLSSEKDFPLESHMGGAHVTRWPTVVKYKKLPPGTYEVIVVTNDSLDEKKLKKKNLKSYLSQLKQDNIKYVELYGDFKVKNFIFIDTQGIKELSNHKWEQIEMLFEKFHPDILLFVSLRIIDPPTLEPSLVKYLLHNKKAPVLISYFRSDQKSDDDDDQTLLENLKKLESSDKILTDNLLEREEFFLDLYQNALVFPSSLLSDEQKKKNFLNLCLENSLSRKLKQLHKKTTCFVALCKVNNSKSQIPYENAFKDSINHALKFEDSKDLKTFVMDNKYHFTNVLTELMKPKKDMKKLIKDTNNIFENLAKIRFDEKFEDIKQFFKQFNDVFSYYLSRTKKKKENQDGCVEKKDYVEIINSIIDKQSKIELKEIKLEKINEKETEKQLDDLNLKMEKLKRNLDEEIIQKSFDEFLVENKIWKSVDEISLNFRENLEEKIREDIWDFFKMKNYEEGSYNWKVLYESFINEGKKPTSKKRSTHKDCYNGYLFTQNDYFYDQIQMNVSDQIENKCYVQSKINIKENKDNEINVKYVKNELIFQMNEETKKIIDSHQEKMKDNNYITPIFILSRLNSQLEMGNIGHSKICQEFEDESNEVYLQFFIIDPSKKNFFKEILKDKFYENGSRKNILILLPEDNLDVDVRLDIQKIFVEKIDFEYWVSVAQTCTGTAELLTIPYVTKTCTLGRCINYLKQIHIRIIENFKKEIGKYVDFKEVMTKLLEDGEYDKMKEFAKLNKLHEDGKLEFFRYENFLFEDHLLEKFRKISSLASIGLMHRKQLHRHLSAVKLKPFEIKPPQNARLGFTFNITKNQKNVYYRDKFSLKTIDIDQFNSELKDKVYQFFGKLHKKNKTLLYPTYFGVDWKNMKVSKISKIEEIGHLSDEDIETSSSIQDIFNKIKNETESKTQTHKKCWNHIYKDSGHQNCIICGKNKVNFYERDFQQCHIIPENQNGPKKSWNLIPGCKCNQGYSNNLLDMMFENGLRKRIFQLIFEKIRSLFSVYDLRILIDKYGQDTLYEITKELYQPKSNLKGTLNLDDKWLRLLSENYFSQTNSENFSQINKRKKPKEFGEKKKKKKKSNKNETEHKEFEEETEEEEFEENEEETEEEFEETEEEEFEEETEEETEEEEFEENEEEFEETEEEFEETEEEEFEEETEEEFEEKFAEHSLELSKLILNLENNVDQKIENIESWRTEAEKADSREKFIKALLVLQEKLSDCFIESFCVKNFKTIKIKSVKDYVDCLIWTMKHIKKDKIFDNSKVKRWKKNCNKFKK